MSENTKRHIISALITFAGSFLAFVIPSLLDPNWAYTGKAAIASLLVAGMRAGVKAVWELPVLQSKLGR